MRTDEKREPAAIVFGGRSPIALSCAFSLAENQKVFLVTRRIDDGLVNEIRDNPAVALLEADLAREDAAGCAIRSLYDKGFEPTALAFLQRYRSAGELSFEEHSRVELWSIAEALEAVANLKRSSTAVNVVLSSSPAAHKVVDDQDLAYHVVKSGQEALARFFGAKMRRNGIHVNAVRVGSLVIKSRAQKYWDSIPEVVKGLEQLSPAGHILSSAEVGARLAALLSPALTGLSGQVFTLDGGFSLLDGSQLARAALEFQEDDCDSFPQ